MNTDFSREDITARLDATELAEAHQGRELPRKDAPDVLAHIAIGARTDLGRVRENNEDKFDFLEPEDPITLANNGALYAVADGMGGHAAGQIASELALKTLIRSYFAITTCDVEARLRTAISEANSMVFDAARAIPDRAGMGTTVVLVVVREDDLTIAHVGDSRAYLIRNGQLQRLTQDHSWVAEQVARGGMTEEEAMRSPYRNVITRSLGIHPTVEPDITSMKLMDGDRILLCSDGLTGPIPDEDLLGLASQGSPSEAALRLIEAANERGGPDNITALIISVRGFETMSQKSPQAPKETTGEAPAAEASPTTGWFARFRKRG